MTKHHESNSRTIHEAHKPSQTTNSRLSKEKRAYQAARHNSSRITQSDRMTGYQQTMNQARQELPRSLRPFSRFIHNRIVERVSEIIGGTLARPNAILAGSISAFVVVLALYSYARYAGFSLQGSETIAAFMLGWLIGVVFDLIRKLVTSKKS